MKAIKTSHYCFQKPNQRGYVDLPYIDQEWLIEHREGVIVLSGGTQGDIAKKLLKENSAEAESAVSFLQEIFFLIHFYLSLSRTVVRMKNVIFKLH